MKKLLLLPIITLSLSAEELSPEQKNDMRLLYLQNACNSCHGNYGEGMGASPRLQGLKEDVILKRLKDLRQGKTRTAFGTIMISFAKALTPEQTILMAKYLANIETKIPKERYDIEFTVEGDGGS
ncbi:c-type cytochrome [Sulfurovum sp. zt1-1]|uniref:C-type cytochrome n=1 Tax=Sulfurovum zhangzhouensis TaxID=3019067 RepID=A0ABT7QWF6_9BACT|nr:c-type cytochrome [Sulfurovum zhangzhouensis]